MAPLNFNKPNVNRPKANLTEFENSLTNGKMVEQIPMYKIEVFNYNGETQPFMINEDEVKALVSSIEQHGQLTPVIVRKIDDKYQLLSGHKRFTACQRLGFKTIDGVVIDVENDETAFDIVCQANVQRKEPKPSELSKMYNTYLSFRKNQDFSKERTADSICELFNVSKKTMYRYANIAKLHEDISLLIDEKKININMIESLVSLSMEQQKSIADYIFKKGRLSAKKLKAAAGYFTENTDSCDINEALDSMSDTEESNSDTEEPANNASDRKNDILSELRMKFPDLIEYTDKELYDYIVILLNNDKR